MVCNSLSENKNLKIYRRVMICKIMLSCFFFFFKDLDIFRLCYLIDRCCVPSMAAQFGAVLDLWKWHWANKGSCISVLKTVPQCRSTQQWPSLSLSHKPANKTNLIKSIPLSLSFPTHFFIPSPSPSTSPRHPSTQTRSESAHYFCKK